MADLAHDEDARAPPDAGGRREDGAEAFGESQLGGDDTWIKEDAHAPVHDGAIRHKAHEDALGVQDTQVGRQKVSRNKTDSR